MPVRAELKAILSDRDLRMRSSLALQGARASERLEVTMCRWPSPATLFEPVGGRLAEIAARLPRALGARAAHARADFATVAPRLRREIVEQRIAHSGERLSSLWRLAGLAHTRTAASARLVRVSDRSGKTSCTAKDAREAGALCLCALRMGQWRRRSTGPRRGLSERRQDRIARRNQGQRPTAATGLFDDEEGRRDMLMGRGRESRIHILQARSAC